MRRMSTHTVIPGSVPVRGSATTFAVHRIYCVGKNYAAHAREMGADPTREAPTFFCKPHDAVVPGGGEVPYPPRTQNLHHEVELVVAIGEGGADIAVADAPSHVYGYALGNDLTRRDLQTAAKNAGQPWDTGKAFDCSAPITAITPVSAGGHVSHGRIWLTVNGELRQQADVADMTWDVPHIIAELSTYFRLQPGDLIFTGTPAGVGALKRGDVVDSGIDGFERLQFRIV
jgi:fumarylpyruvate hydrolase